MSIWKAPFIVSTVLLVSPSVYSAEKTTGVDALTQNELDIRSDDFIERVKTDEASRTNSPSDTEIDVLADQLLERMRRESVAQSNDLTVTESGSQEDPVTPVSNSAANTESEEPVDVITNQQDEPDTGDEGTSTSNWLAVQPPENITIQFSASPEQASLESFLENSQLPEPTAIFEFDRNGRTWYALVHGSFSSTRDAQAALAEMPQRTKLYNPWLRRFNSIQDISN